MTEPLFEAVPEPPKLPLGHSIHWTLEPDYITGHLVCHDSHADCHWYCAVGCEDQCTGYADGREHEKHHSDTCNYIDWIENGDGVVSHYNGEEVSVVDGYIDFEWDGDDCYWHYSGGPS